MRRRHHDLHEIAMAIENSDYSLQSPLVLASQDVTPKRRESPQFAKKDVREKRKYFKKSSTLLPPIQTVAFQNVRRNF